MKIGMYVPSWPPGTAANGIVTYASHVIPALRYLGHEVYVLTLDKTEDSDAHTIDLKAFQKRPSFWDRAKFKIAPHDAYFSLATQALVDAVKYLVTAKGIEVFEIEESFGWSYPISKLNLIPVVVRLHGPWFITKKFSNPTREAHEKRGILHAEIVTAPSQYVLDRIVSSYGRGVKNIIHLKNPIFRVSELERWKINGCDTSRILFVGRFDEIKGGDLAIQAFGKLAQRNRNLKMTFVGPDDGYKGLRCLAYAKSVLSTDAIARLTCTGKLTPMEIVPLRRSHFLTLCSSRVEVLGYSVLEAMAYGCPVVASAVGGIPELINTGKNGLLYETQDPECLAATIQKVLDDHALAAELGENAWSTATNFEPKQVATDTAEVYRQVAHQYKVSKQHIA